MSFEHIDLVKISPRILNPLEFRGGSSRGKSDAGAVAG
jgi:hypothetical protein